LTRWLIETKQDEIPKAFQDSHIYGIRIRIQIAGFGVTGLFLLLIVAFRHELAEPRGLWLLAIPVCFMVLGLWLATGTVITSDRGITQKSLWSSRTIGWDEVSSVRFYERQKYIEVRGNHMKINVDLRFVALTQLLKDILGHTKVHLETK